MRKIKLNINGNSITPRIEAIITAFIVIALVFFSTYLLYIKSVESLEKEIKIGLLSNVSAAATTIDGDLHPLFNKDSKREDSLYISQIAPLEKIRKVAKDIRYIYTTILIDDKVYFVLNPSPQNDNDNDGFPDLPPALMDEYKGPAPALLKALKEQRSIVSDVYTDEWGVFISGYAPFYDSNGQFIGTLGMDLELNNFYERLRPIEIAFEKTVIIIIFIGLIIGLLIWYMRKYMQTLLLAKEKSKEVEHTFQMSLENAFKEQIQIIKKIKNNLAPLKPANITLFKHFDLWITHVIQYQKSKIEVRSVSFENFQINDLIDGIKNTLEREGVKLNVEKKKHVPLRGSGIPLLLAVDLISTLLFFIKNATQCNALDIIIRQLEEGVDHFIIELKLSGIRSQEFEEEFLKQLYPGASFSHRAFNYKEYEVATAINLLHKYKCKAISFSNLKHCGFYVQIKLNKQPET
ncbi:PDC sensor domain-containing protein [Flavivirga aquimarina]|uniref:PDC sensor domain-containing protein n=1 Tax=Flavivirga aquimarina TaxID=2027862 RepID=A0ABT8WBL5_9FLAO|nr:PDC sensor domain-containing protein [Flavivirga aquimarina]MDO5970501.1 PDC sensor domain-containing protein [Flavivirga aquimarina]